MSDTGKIIIKDELGKNHECNIIFTFESKEYDKNYVIYTDNSLDELGNTKIYANTFDPYSDYGDLGKINTKEEWDLIEQILSSINSGGISEEKNNNN